MDKIKARLVAHFKQLFEHFKYTYTHFHTLFHPHVYQTPKQHYSNSFTKHPINDFICRYCILSASICVSDSENSKNISFLPKGRGNTYVDVA